MSRTLSGKESTLLYVMSYLVFDDQETNPCTTLLHNMRNHGSCYERLADLNKSMRRLHGIGHQMQRFVKELRAKRPWPENLRWPERRRVAFMVCMAAYYGPDDISRKDLSNDERTALHFLLCQLTNPTLSEQRTRKKKYLADKQRRKDQ